MREPEARALLAVLVAAFPRQVLEQPTVDLYAGALRSLESATAAKQAVEAVIRSSHTFPSVAAIRQVYGESRRRELEAAAHTQRALEAGEPVPRELPPEAREYLAGLRLRTMDGAETKANETLAALPKRGRGKCHDCRVESELARLGSFDLCVRCVVSRLRVGAELEAEEKREAARA